MSQDFGHGLRAEPVVYRWADGSEVLLTARGCWSYSENKNVLSFEFRVIWADRYASSVEFEIMPTALEKRPTLYVPFRLTREAELADQKKLRGFVLDLGVDRLLPHFTGLVTTHIGGKPSIVPYPRFVSVHDWDNRYTQALDHVVHNFHDLVLCKRDGAFPVSHLKFQKPRDRSSDPFWYKQTRWNYRWYNNGAKIEREADSLEQAVDDVLQTENILPESAREAWDKENVERGVFVLPTPEEVEVFRILDEPLPFFLPWREVEAWLQASGIWP